jgi:anti-sigma regulatory factor (Ser/Thr protein kinase)
VCLAIRSEPARLRAPGEDRSGWTGPDVDPVPPASGYEGEAMAGETVPEPAHAAWPSAPVPSVPGDVWHWQLEAMHTVSRVRSDLRARIAHPSVSAASTDDARDGLLLVFEELASNALRHGGGDVRALVVAGPNGWLLDLSDEAPDRPPVPAVDRDPALGGMGLHLVAQLSTDYGWEGRPGRKHVWARLPSGRTEGSEWQRNQLPEPRAPHFHRD